MNNCWTPEVRLVNSVDWIDPIVNKYVRLNCWTHEVRLVNSVDWIDPGEQLLDSRSTISKHCRLDRPR